MKNNNNVTINGKIIGNDGKQVPAKSIAQPHPTLVEKEPEIVTETPPKAVAEELLKKNSLKRANNVNEV